LISVVKMLQNLMPRGSAWKGVQDGFMLKLLTGLSKEYGRLREKAYKLGNALFPQVSEYIPEWEYEFQLPTAPGLNPVDRKNRVFGRWAMITQGSMQSDNMEFIFSLSGIDLVARPLDAGENPNGYFLLEGQAFYGNLLSQYGRTRYGDVFPIATPDNQLLINGGSFDYAVDPAIAGALIPSDSDFWGMLYVLEGEGGQVLEIEAKYREVFYDIVYATKPVNMWAIARVNFISRYIFAPPGISETRRFYWDYDTPTDTSIIYIIMDSNESPWEAPNDDYLGIVAATINYKKQVFFGEAPDGNTFDGNTTGAGPASDVKDIKITSLGGVNYESINQGDYIEHIFYLTNNGTPTATIEVDGLAYPANNLTGVLPWIEYDDVDKVDFDNNNPDGVIIL